MASPGLHPEKSKESSLDKSDELWVRRTYTGGAPFCGQLAMLRPRGDHLRPGDSGPCDLDGLNRNVPQIAHCGANLGLSDLFHNG